MLSLFNFSSFFYLQTLKWTEKLICSQTATFSNFLSALSRIQITKAWLGALLAHAMTWHVKDLPVYTEETCPVTGMEAVARWSL